MSRTRFIATSLPVLALSVFVPQHAHAASFKDFVDKTIMPIGNSIITLLYALSFLFFLYGLVRLFFSYSEESRQKGKLFAFWGIIGLAVLFTVWGFVRILLGVITSIGA